MSGELQILHGPIEISIQIDLNLPVTQAGFWGISRLRKTTRPQSYRFKKVLAPTFSTLKKVLPTTFSTSYPPFFRLEKSIWHGPIFPLPLRGWSIFMGIRDREFCNRTTVYFCSLPIQGKLTRFTSIPLKKRGGWSIFEAFCENKISSAGLVGSGLKLIFH